MIRLVLRDTHNAAYPVLDCNPLVASNRVLFVSSIRQGIVLCEKLASLKYKFNYIKMQIM